MRQLVGELILIGRLPSGTGAIQEQFDFVTITKNPDLTIIIRKGIGQMDHWFPLWIRSVTLTLEKIERRLRDPEDIHKAGGLQVVGVATVIIEHDPVAIGEGRCRKIIIVRLLNISCLLQQAQRSIPT